MRDPFDATLFRRGPVHRKGLRAGPNDHSDKLMDLTCGKASRFVEHLTKHNRISCPRLRGWNRPTVALTSLSI